MSKFIALLLLVPTVAFAGGGGEIKPEQLTNLSNSCASGRQASCTTLVTNLRGSCNHGISDKCKVYNGALLMLSKRFGDDAATIEWRAHGFDEGGNLAPGTPPVNWFQGNPWAFSGKDVYGRDLKDPAADTHNKATPAVFWMFVNFAIVLFILWKKAVPVFRRMAKKKHVDIKDSLEEGARKKAEAEATLEAFDAKLRVVKSEGEELVAGIKKSAESEKTRLMEEAKLQAEATKKAADAQVEASLQLAKHSLKAEVVAEALVLAEKKLEVEAGKNPAVLIDNFIASLEAQAGAQ